jgi:hypothetical protein
MADDPTRNERQRLYRARRKAKAAGLVEVTVADARGWLPPKRAAKVRQWIEEAGEGKHDDQSRDQGTR